MDNFIICRPMMLPTQDNISPIHESYKDDKKLFYQDGRLNNGNRHLYLVSDREIKKGDYVIQDGQVRKVLGSTDAIEPVIIATTHKSLGLPLIPEQWIREVYVPAQGKIEKVKILTYEEEIKTIYVGNGTAENREFVQILPIKDSFTKEDMERAYNAGQNPVYVDGELGVYATDPNFNDWFNQNY